MDRRDDNFRNGIFNWFTGEVTKLAPDGSNRVKVFPHGYYDDKFRDEDKADFLPWATVMMPCTTAGVEGATQNHGLEVGTWVVGFFRDGPSAQDPIIMGVITGNSNISKDVKDTGPEIKQQTFKGGQSITFDDRTGNIILAGSITGKITII